MIPVIQELLDAEARAREIVTRARETVQREQSDTDQKEHAELAEARRAAEARYQQAVADARTEMERRHADAMMDLKTSADTFRTRRKDDIEHAVDLVVEQLCRSDLESE